MKKIKVLLIVTAMSVLFAACGGTQPEQEQMNQENIQEEAVTNKEKDFIYGKVVGIVGNEIEIKVGTLPEQTEADTEEIKQEAPSAGGSMASSTLSAAESVDASSMDLDYTGETIKVTIPAGVSVKSQGNDTTLSSVKDGSVISLIVEDKDAENLVIEQIDIII